MGLAEGKKFAGSLTAGKKESDGFSTPRPGCYPALRTDRASRVRVLRSVAEARKSSHLTGSVRWGWLLLQGGENGTLEYPAVTRCVINDDRNELCF